MKDIFGNTLEVGDTVAFNPPKYKGMVLGVIKHFSPKSVRVIYDPTGKQNTTETSVHPCGLAKKP